MWTEVQQVQEHQRRELVLSSSEIAKRVEESGLDEHVFDLATLNFLEISRTPLTILSDKIGHLENLNRLILHDNKLKEIPQTVRLLTKLKVLDISKNCLSELPDVFGNLRDLQSLNASVNEIAKISDLSHCVHLTSINLSHNKLVEFPEVLCSDQLENLLELNLNSNLLTGISPRIDQLPALKHLDLSSNKITIIPKELSQCGKLREILLHDNPIKDSRLCKLTAQKPPKSKAVLDYVREHCVAQIPVTESENKQKAAKKKSKGNKSVDEEEVVVDEIEVLPADETSRKITWKAVTQQVRPFIVCCVIKNLELSDPEKMKKFIALQSDLHDDICEKRTAATIATHDLDQISDNMVYDAKSPQSIKICPLKRSAEVSADILMNQLKQEADALRKEKKRNTFSGIHKYLNLLHEKTVYPCLLTESGTVLSLPPLTNSEKSKILPTTQNVLLEVTSSKSLAVCKAVAEKLITACVRQDLTSESRDNGNGEHSVGRKIVVQQLRVMDESGGLRVVFPSRADLNMEGFKILRSD
ncbi:leucine-rich repeat-containing protein 47-like [Paramacrobiotus metropolitanus]|uniref:leucine-rich repeat-containing protein 47-like n=1 Tax=Paramacrobiotus metropolitanus TaxID=2943436 RepID=UPI002445FCB6|nr:leucine-rich repeat-containing protein 47-like [Paramacrobiotus metropolitanus]XP_055342838.1 leucine-rich repeat-containing protein 47-like [Paramacrobiotus metropolitanus]